MRLNIPYRVRAILYVVAAVATPVVVYLKAKGVIGDLETTLWSALVTAVTGLAALNVTPEKE